MNKKLILSLAAAGLFASCAVDEQPGSTTALSDNNTIAFNMQTASQSRAQETGSTAANTLGNMFIVWGEKNETVGTAVTDANTVFKNYVVKYTENSKSVSNTAGWEYVGYIPYTQKQVSPAITGAQTIKYWDDQASSYTFTAISAKEEDIQNGKVIITKNPGSDATSNSSTTVYDKGYTVQVKDGASVDNIYFSDRNNVTKNDGKFSHKAVSMSFRNFMSKIRFGIYETVPGYKVVITGLKYSTASGDDNVAIHTNGSSVTDGKTFGITGNFVVPGDKTSYTVTYGDNNSGKENKAKVTLGESASTATYKNTAGTNWLSTKWSATASDCNCVSENAASPTYDKTEVDNAGAYTTIMPNPGNKTEMTLTISYDLYSEDTGEKISVDYKTVKVPAEYCQWKSNYAYTYLFKITDQNTGLSPITFDAVVETDEIANQETITTVDAPSITTYVKGKLVDDEYAGGDDIYAFAQDDNVTAMSVDNMKLYKVTRKEGTALDYAITEGSVDDALNNDKVLANDNKLTVTQIKTDGSEPDKPSYTQIPAEDGTTRSITGMKWTATAGTTYAIEYIKTVEQTQKKYYKIVKVAATTSDNQETEDGKQD